MRRNPRRLKLRTLVRLEPFKVTLRTRNLEIARVYADAMLVSANAPEDRLNASDCPQKEAKLDP